MTKEKTLIFDANNLLHRIYWMNQKYDSGRDLKVIFLQSIKKQVEQFCPDNIYAAWDKKLTYPSTNFRKEELDIDYKGNRDHPDDIHNDDDIIMELLQCMGVKNIFPNVMEADDVIAWLCKNISGEKIIVSVDADLLQLINNTVKVYSPIKKIIIDENNFEKNVGVTIKEYLCYKSLLGDPSDNIPGIPKVGKVTAKKYAQKWCNNPTALNNLLTENQMKQWKTNLKLIDLSIGYTIHDNEEECYKQQKEQLDTISPDFKKFYQKIKTLKMHNIIKNFNIYKTAFKNTKIIESSIISLVERLGLNTK